MHFLIVLLSAGYTSYLIACGYETPTLYAITGLGWLMVWAQWAQDSHRA